MDSDSLDSVAHEDLPHYSLRVSGRAKRLQIKVNHWGKVEVVVPRNVSLGHVAPFVRKHRKWLERALTQVKGTADVAPAAAGIPPDRIRLPALNENWEIVYRSGGRMCFEAEDGLDCPRRLRIETAEDEDARIPLQQWIHDYARRRLPQHLRQVSEECDLHYARVTVRAQKTRWGSCSARGHINLNRHLLFLPPHLMRYIMIHELCHTVHLNHSQRYWRLVSRFVPDFEACETELRRAARYIPFWACPD